MYQNPSMDFFFFFFCINEPSIFSTNSDLFLEKDILTYLSNKLKPFNACFALVELVILLKIIKAYPLILLFFLQIISKISPY